MNERGPFTNIDTSFLFIENMLQTKQIRPSFTHKISQHMTHTQQCATQVEHKMF